MRRKKNLDQAKIIPLVYYKLHEINSSGWIADKPILPFHSSVKTPMKENIQCFQIAQEKDGLLEFQEG